MMNKTTKIAIGVAGAGILAFLVYKGVKGISSKFSTNKENTNSTNTTNTQTGDCPAGKVKCPNSSFCYTPGGIINPCFFIFN